MKTRIALLTGAVILIVFIITLLMFKRGNNIIEKFNQVNIEYEKGIHYRGFVKKLMTDSGNVNVGSVILDNETLVNLVHYRDAAKYIQVNDFIIKEAGAATVVIIREDAVKEFNYDYKVKEIGE